MPAWLASHAGQSFLGAARAGNSIVSGAGNSQHRARIPAENASWNPRHRARNSIQPPTSQELGAELEPGTGKRELGTRLGRSTVVSEHTLFDIKHSWAKFLFLGGKKGTRCEGGRVWFKFHGIFHLGYQTTWEDLG